MVFNMIDDKKIEEAKDEIFEDKLLGNGTDVIYEDGDKEELYDSCQVKEAISLGAKWAINEFLKDLLHPASEIPHSKDGYCSVYIFCKNKNINNVLYIEKENIWKELIDRCQGIAWCYIGDLFPKKGDLK